MEIIDVLKMLNASCDLGDVEKIAVVSGMEMLRCERGCFVSFDGNKEFVIKFGIPFSGHGIGEKVSKECGADFFKKIAMEKSCFEVIGDVCRNPKTEYFLDHAKKFGIVGTIFFPVFCSGRLFGLLIFDSTTQKKFSQEGIKKVLRISGDAGAALSRIHRMDELLEQKSKRESLNVLGLNSAMVAHSLRNPLLSIGGFARMAIKKLNKSNLSEEELEAVKDYCQTILMDTERMERLVSDILVFNRITTSRMDFRACDIPFLLEGVAKSFEAQHRENNIKIKLVIDFRLKRTKVFLNEDMMRFCVEDLIRNAIEAGASAIKIKARIKAKKGFLVITVSNNGEPLESIVAEKIFAPFMTRKPDGTGLGLANVRAVVEAHNGKVWAEGQEMGFSKFKTKFKIEIPL